MQSVKNFKIVQALAPSADVFAGTKNTQPLNQGLYNDLEFVIQKGAGATGTVTMKAQKCDDTSGTNAVDVPFLYDIITDDGNEVTANAEGTTSGIALGTTENRIFVVRVPDNLKGVASVDKKYVRLNFVEGTDSPIVGSVLALCTGYGGDITGVDPTV